MEIEIIRSAHPSVVLIGGACATNTADIHIEGFAQTPFRDIVLISSELEMFLTEEEFGAIIAHERAHIKLGHLALVTKENTITVGDAEISIMPEQEIEADAYAVSLFGAENLLRALKKTVDWVFDSAVFAAHLADLGVSTEQAEDCKIAGKEAGHHSYEYRAKAMLATVR